MRTSPVWWRRTQSRSAVGGAVVAVLTATTALAAHAEPRPVAPTVRPMAADSIRPVSEVGTTKRPAPSTNTLRSVPVRAARWPATETGSLAAGAAPGARASAGPVSIGWGKRRPSARTDVVLQPSSVADELGVRGLVVDVRAGGADRSRGPLDVRLDYSQLVGAYGGDWVSRLRLVELPSCALSTPTRTECRRASPLPSTNDPTTRTLAASVPARPAPVSGSARAVASASTVVAAVASASGSGGTFTATSLAPSGSWSAGGSSGGFGWTMPVAMPPAPAGSEPQVALSYSSSAVDGRQVSTNNQPSWVGEGWDYNPGYIERQYKACSEDQTGGNNTVKTADLCWYSDNAVLSLGGKTTELVRDDTTGAWRLAENDGSRVERLTGAVNGDNDGEYWRVTTTDGTQYYFGRQRLPGWVSGKAETNSTFTVPVFGNQVGEPCRASTFDASSCTQAWRWNLDHVVDPSSNTASYWYTKETNYYGRNLKTTGVSYVRGGYLSRIEYGGRLNAEYSTPAPDRVLFDVAERCLPTTGFTCSDAEFVAANAARWPDVPMDQACKSGEACTNRYSPTFWSRKRLAAIRTEALASATTYAAVDTYALAQSYPNSGDGLSPALWLSSITRTGKVGGTAALDPVTFSGVQLSNRVDSGTDGIPALYRYRVNAVRSESGGVLGVSYSSPQCSPTNLPTSDSTNGLRCYPVTWSPPDSTGSPIKEYFHKYLVTQVLEQDGTGTQPAKVTAYEYVGAPAWAYDESEATKPENRSWNQFRGYGTVRTRVGSGTDPVTLNEARYFRGMDGDKLPTGTRSATVTDSFGTAVTDVEEYAGTAREVVAYDRDGGSIVSSTLNSPWRSPVLATRARSGLSALTSRAVQVVGVDTKQKLSTGTWRTTRTTRTFTDDGVPLTVEAGGDTGSTADDTCTRMEYPAVGAARISASPSRTWTTVGPCSATVTSGAQVVADARSYYDNATSLTAAPTRGLVTKVEELASWPSGGSATYATSATTTYDATGRVSTSTDAAGAKTTYGYTQTPAGGPLTSTTSTNALGHVTTSTVDAARGDETALVDPNGKRTDATYDPLGRLLKAWLPGRAKATQTPSMDVSYVLSTTAPSSVTTKRLKDDGTYETNVELLDGLLRQIQTQVPAATGGRLVTDTFYDTAGRVLKTNAPYYALGTPATTRFSAADNEVPTQHVTEFDGMGRPTADVLRGYGTEKWRTKTAYAGELTTVDPPTGSPATAEVTDALGRVTERRRYPSGSPTGAFDSTLFAFDAKGRLDTVTAPGGARWTYAYDQRGRTTRTTDPDTGATDLTYDSAGRVESSRNAVGQTVFTTYDILSRPTSTNDTTKTGATRTSFVYDTVMKGQLTSASRWQGANEYRTTVLGYDDGYRTTGTRWTIPANEGALGGKSYDLQQVFSPNGNLLRQLLPAAGGLPQELVTYAYSTNEDLARVTSNLGRTYLNDVLRTSYGEVGRLYLGGSGKTVYVGYQYDDVTRRLTQMAIDRDVAPTRVEERTFGYDQSGNILSQTSTVAGVKDSQCYAYDGLARLREAWTSTDACAGVPSVGTGGTVGGPQAYWQTYTYDGSGNRDIETRHAVTASGTDVVRDYTYPSVAAGQPHTVRSVGETGPSGQVTRSYAFDAAGRMTSRDGTTQTWDPEGKLASSTKGGVTSTYLYDAAGERLLRREPGAVTLYMGGTQLTLNTATQTVTGERIVGLGGASVVRSSTGSLTYVVDDHQGTGQWSIDATTLSATQRTLDPFGRQRGTSGSTGWPAGKGFVGGDTDASGLTHLGAREYDPDIGSFVSADPLLDLSDPQQMNGYGYANNSPVTYSDSTGLAPQGPTDDSVMGYTWNPKTQRNEPDPGKIHYTKPKNAGGSSTHRGGSPPSDPVMREKVRKAQEVKKRDLMDIVMTAGADILLEVTGIKDIQTCFGKGDIGACISMVIGFIPWTKLAKAGKVIGALRRAWDAYFDWRREAAAADRFLASVCMLSFSGSTLVLMGDGSQKPIEDVDVGDEVVATDPETGERSVRKVERVWLHEDQVVDLGVDGEVVTTTEDHPFWSETDQAFEDAQDLAPGEKVLTADGRRLTVSGLKDGTQHLALAYNLTVEGVHTYHVGRNAILVHNTGGCGVSYARPSGYRSGVRDKVWQNAIEPATGRVRDKLTGRFMSKDSPWDMGHKEGFEFRKHQASAESRGISRPEFLTEHNNPEHYRPELPSSNRGHLAEDQTDAYFGP
ncbi:GH-E family nuclease [Phycicoccus avicenniae]|uniref:GH-E family nuclease n=1 Tax=Phycicoccus avicenniae TaxID=2828860 RepID=UPI003D2B5E5D